MDFEKITEQSRQAVSEIIADKRRVIGWKEEEL